MDDQFQQNTQQEPPRFFSYYRAESDEFPPPPELLPIRPGCIWLEDGPSPFHSPAEFRARIRPEGITGDELWDCYLGHTETPSKRLQYEFYQLMRLTLSYSKEEYRYYAREPLPTNSLPRAAEIRARIPPEGILASTLIDIYRVQTRTWERKREFHDLLFQVARYERATGLLKPLPPPLPSAAELRSKIPAEGTSVRELLVLYNDAIVGDERKNAFKQLLTANCTYDKERNLIMLKPSQ